MPSFHYKYVFLGEKGTDPCRVGSVALPPQSWDTTDLLGLVMGASQSLLSLMWFQASCSFLMCDFGKVTQLI